MLWSVFEALCAQWAEIWKVPPLILWVVATIESQRHPEASNTVDPRAAAKGGAWGLFGMTLDTARQLMSQPELQLYRAAERYDGTGPSLLDPGLNTMLASYYLGQQWKKFGEFVPTVAAYHSGPDTVRKILDGGGDLTTDLGPHGREYVAKALAVRDELRERLAA